MKKINPINYTHKYESIETLEPIKLGALEGSFYLFQLSLYIVLFIGFSPFWYLKETNIKSQCSENILFMMWIEGCFALLNQKFKCCMILCLIQQLLI